MVGTQSYPIELLFKSRARSVVTEKENGNKEHKVLTCSKFTVTELANADMVNILTLLM